GKAMRGGVETDNLRVRFTALAGAADRGSSAASLVPVLEKLSRDDSNEMIRTAAKGAVDRIRGKGPATPSSTASNDLNRLREEIQRLKREQDVLRERLNKFEKSEKRAG